MGRLLGTLLNDYRTIEERFAHNLIYMLPPPLAMNKKFYKPVL